MKLLEKQKLEFFKKLLLEKNKSINLFSRKQPLTQLDFLFEQACLTRHTLSLALKKEPAVLDIGSGGGFPAIPLAIFQPKTLFYLCEANRKKAEFLKYVANQLKLDNVEVLCQRAENLETSFSRITSQAAMPLPEMLKLLQKLLKDSGKAFLWKSFLWKEELSKSTFKIQNFKIKEIQSYKLKDSKCQLLQITKTEELV